MKEINARFNFYPARNAEHYQAHSDLLAAITPDFATTLGIAPLREEYQRLFAVENDCYLRNASYQDTPEVEAKDRRRDELFLYVSRSVSAATLCPVEATAAAAGRVAYHLAPYRDAPRLNYASNTAAVADFVQKMRDPAHAADIDALGLTAALDALDAANNDFNRVYTGRSAELLTRATSETMKTIRPQVDAAYKALASAINALYQVNELVTRNAAQEKEIGAVIDRANAVLVQLQSTLSRAGVAGKPAPAADARPGGGTTGGSSSGGTENPGSGGGSGNQNEDVLG